jgi:hypothetical protein
MGKLHELLAVIGDLNGKANKILEETKHIFSKGDDFVQGENRTYHVRVEGEEQLKPEGREMRTTVPDRMSYTLGAVIDLMNAQISREMSNTTAFADVTVDGNIVAAHLSAQALLSMETSLKAFRDIVEKAPTLDASIRWEPETTMSHVFRSPPEVKVRTKKIEDYKVIVPATKEHPAQVAKATEDRPVGEWTTVKFSGAISAVTKARWLSRLDAHLMAVKQARQRANMAEIVPSKVAQALFASIFGEDLK